MDFSALIIKMIIFAVLLLIGYVMAKKDILTPSFVKGASSLLVNVFLPASVINSVLGERPELSASEFGEVFFLTTLALVLYYVIAYLACLPLPKNEHTRQTELMMANPNNLFVGLPILASLCGSEAVFYVGMATLPFNLLFYSYGVWRLTSGKKEYKFHMKDMMSICLISSFVALAIFLWQIRVPVVISDLCSTIADGTVPLSMVIIGATMGKINPVSAFGEKRMYYLSLIRLIVCPVIAFFVCRMLTDNEVLLITCTVLSGCPVAVLTTAVSVQYGFDGTFTSKGIMVTTVLCMITIPLLLFILF